jgi:hypothetical protein
MMENAVSESALNQLFLKARTYNEWSDKTVDDSTVRQVYELLIGERAAEAAKYFAQPGVIESTAMRNGSLRGAYLIIAARARLGLRAHVGF